MLEDEKHMKNLSVHQDPWANLRQHTAARIALGRAGHSVPTHELLAFQVDHALARDAVYSELNISGLQEKLAALFQSVALIAIIVRVALAIVRHRTLDQVRHQPPAHDTGVVDEAEPRHRAHACIVRDLAAQEARRAIQHLQ